MTIQIRISRAQHDETRRGRVFPIEEDHNAQATLKRLVPHHGGIQMQMRFLWPRAEVFETVQVAYLLLADNVSRSLPFRLHRVNQPVISTPNVFSTPRPILLACI